MFPWSVMPTAGWPSAAAVATTSWIARRAVEHRVLGVQVEVDERLGQCRASPRLRHSTGVATALWMNHTDVVRRRSRAPATAAAAATSGTSTSAAVIEPWAERRPASRGNVGSTKPTASRAASTTSPTRRQRRPGGSGPEPPLVEQLLATEHPRVAVAQRAPRPRRGAPRPRPSLRVQVAEPRRRRRRRRPCASSAPSPIQTPARGCTWPWSAVTRSATSSGSTSRSSPDEPVGGRELGRVEAPFEAVRVRDLVDARVVRVHERRAAGDERAHVLDQHRRWSASRGSRRRGGARR